MEPGGGRRDSLAASREAGLERASHGPKIGINCPELRIERNFVLSIDTILAYLISIAIITFGIVWAFVSNAGSAVAPAWLVLGILTVVIGLVSLWCEYSGWSQAVRRTAPHRPR